MSSKLKLENLPAGENERRALAQKLKSDTHVAKSRGELISAMLYACDALMLFPNDGEYLALVDELCASKLPWQRPRVEERRARRIGFRVC